METATDTRLHTAWLHLFDLGWSVAKIADTWTLPTEAVDTILNDLSMRPTPSIRQVLPLPTTSKAAEERRRNLHDLAKGGMPREDIARVAPYYSPDVLDTILGQATRRRLVKENPCKCGCRRKALGRAYFATDACRKRYDRRGRWE